MYLTCLVNTGGQISINPAVRRRDSLLAAHAAPVTSSTGAKLQESGGSEFNTTLSPTEDDAAVQQNLSPSQQIAQNVLSGQPEPISSSNYNKLDLAKLSGSPEGAGATPIQVTIVERKHQ